MLWDSKPEIGNSISPKVKSNVLMQSNEHANMQNLANALRGVILYEFRDYDLLFALFCSTALKYA